MKTAIVILDGGSNELIRRAKDVLKSFCWLWTTNASKIESLENTVSDFGQFSDMDSIKRKGKEYEIALLLIRAGSNSREIKDIFGAIEIYVGCSDDRYTHDYVIDVNSPSFDEELKSVVSILTK